MRLTPVSEAILRIVYQNCTHWASSWEANGVNLLTAEDSPVVSGSLQGRVINRRDADTQATRDKSDGHGFESWCVLRKTSAQLHFSVGLAVDFVQV